LNKYKIIYIYYYKFKRFREKRARSIFQRTENKHAISKILSKSLKRKRKILTFTKYNYTKFFGAKNFTFKNLVNNKKRYKILFGYPNKILLTVNFRNLLLVPGVRFKKLKPSTPLVVFIKKSLKKNYWKNIKKKII